MTWGAGAAPQNPWRSVPDTHSFMGQGPTNNALLAHEAYVHYPIQRRETVKTFRLGIVEWALPVTGPACVRLAAEMGLQGVELDFGDFEKGFPLSNQRIQSYYLEYAAQHGIEFPSLALNAFALNGMSRPRNSGKGLAAVEAIKKGVAAAAKMGIPVIQLPSFDDGAIQSEEDFRNTVEKIRLACRLAEPHGIVIASENILSAEETERMIAEVDTENFRIMFDTQNYNLNKGYNEADLLRKIHRHVIQVHIKDGYNKTISSALIGEGENGFLETAQVIIETACTDWLLFENYYHIRPLSDLNEDPFELLRRDIEKARAVFPIAVPHA